MLDVPYYLERSHPFAVQVGSIGPEAVACRLQTALHVWKFSGFCCAEIRIGSTRKSLQIFKHYLMFKKCVLLNISDLKFFL